MSGMYNFDSNVNTTDHNEFYRKYMAITTRLEDLAERIRQMPRDKQDRLFREFNERIESQMGRPDTHDDDFPMQLLLFFTFIACLMVLLVIFVFFGYKLYKSLTDKQRKREEKRKQKQMKKKK